MKYHAKRIIITHLSIHVGAEKALKSGAKHTPGMSLELGEQTRLRWGKCPRQATEN